MKQRRHSLPVTGCSKLNDNILVIQTLYYEALLYLLITMSVKGTQRFLEARYSLHPLIFCWVPACVSKFKAMASTLTITSTITKRTQDPAVERKRGHSFNLCGKGKKPRCYWT